MSISISVTAPMPMPMLAHTHVHVLQGAVCVVFRWEFRGILHTEFRENPRNCAMVKLIQKKTLLWTPFKRSKRKDKMSSSRKFTQKYNNNTVGRHCFSQESVLLVTFFDDDIVPFFLRPFNIHSTAVEGHQYIWTYIYFVLCVKSYTRIALVNSGPANKQRSIYIYIYIVMHKRLYQHESMPQL